MVTQKFNLIALIVIVIGTVVITRAKTKIRLNFCVTIDRFAFKCLHNS